MRRRAELKRNATAIVLVLAGVLLGGAAGAGFRVLDEAARPGPDHPDFFAWEACATYIPRWVLPYMRDCVEDARLASRGEVARQQMAGYAMCTFP